jgi:hypothetical protein
VVPDLEVRGNGGSEATQHPRKSIGAGTQQDAESTQSYAKTPCFSAFFGKIILFLASVFLSNKT